MIARIFDKIGAKREETTVLVDREVKQRERHQRICLAYLLDQRNCMRGAFSQLGGQNTDNAMTLIRCIHQVTFD